MIYLVTLIHNDREILMPYNPALKPEIPKNEGESKKLTIKEIVLCYAKGVLDLVKK